MRRLSAALMGVWTLLGLAPFARGEQASDLLFFSGDLISQRNFVGVGWLHAAAGLDASGLVFSTELGRQRFDRLYGQSGAGWRFSHPEFSLTITGGVELTPRRAPAFRPLASFDFWWEPLNNWMTNAQIQATQDYVSWRLAAGMKPAPNWPWLGPEVSASCGDFRTGIHATGLRLGAGFEARASVGVSRLGGKTGPYGEMSIWRRF
jgi:hypothetical protein